MTTLREEWPVIVKKCEEIENDARLISRLLEKKETTEYTEVLVLRYLAVDCAAVETRLHTLINTIYGKKGE